MWVETSTLIKSARDRSQQAENQKTFSISSESVEMFFRFYIEKIIQLKQPNGTGWF